MGTWRLPVGDGAVVVVVVVVVGVVVVAPGELVVPAVVAGSVPVDVDVVVAGDAPEPVEGAEASSAVPHPTASTMHAALTAAIAIGRRGALNMMGQIARSTAARNDGRRVLEAPNRPHSIAWP